MMREPKAFQNVPDDNQPATADTDLQPTLPVEDLQPTFPVEDSQSAFSVEDSQPTVPVVEKIIPQYPGLFFPMMTRLNGGWKAATANTKAAVGLSFILFFVLVALLGALFIHTNPNAFSSDILAPPSSSHWFGTTQTGQDVFTQVVVGTRTSLFWGFLTGLVVTLFSVVIGLAAGYIGGIVDDILTLLINIFLVLPPLPLAVLLAAYIPVKGPFTVAMVIALTSWAYQARVLRAQTLSMKQRDFVGAAKSSGESTWRIIFFEILPNEVAIVAAGFIGTAIYVILTAASLEFLGLGDPNTVDWGTMFYWAQNNDALLLGAWWWFVAPGLCIAFLGAGLALINFGIDEIANPLLRSQRAFSKKIMKSLRIPTA